MYLAHVFDRQDDSCPLCPLSTSFVWVGEGAPKIVRLSRRDEVRCDMLQYEATCPLIDYAHGALVSTVCDGSD